MEETKIEWYNGNHVDEKYLNYKDDTGNNILLITCMRTKNIAKIKYLIEDKKFDKNFLIIIKIIYL
jgi:hypothetical protein